MLTLEQILKASDPSILKNINKYKLEALQSQKGTDSHGDYNRFLSQVTGGSQPRRSAIHFYEDIIVASPVLVYCSCDYFKYNLEIALVANGSAVQLHANGLYPKKKNPGFKPGLCVHLAYLARVVLSLQKNQNKAKKIYPKINPKLK